MTLEKGKLYRRKDDKAIGYYLGSKSLATERHLFGATPRMTVASWTAEIEEIEEVLERSKYYGQYILVKDVDNIWVKRICLDLLNEGVICVTSIFEEEFKNNEAYTTVSFREWKPVEEKRKITLELTEGQIQSIRNILGENLC